MRIAHYPAALFIAAAFCGAVFAQIAPAAQTAPANGYAGSGACRTCHPDVWQKVYRNPHYASFAESKDTGCEGCHGPASAHVAARGGKGNIYAFSQAKPREIIDNCLRCHEQRPDQANIRRSPHSRNDVACTVCHSIHKPSGQRFLLTREQPELCYSCHTKERADFSMPFRHHVNEGAVACTDCHNAHGAPSPTWRMAAHPSLVSQDPVNEEACMKCHSDKRGPFAFEHPPVRVEGCEICHLPHGSTNARLLRRPVVFTMCLECHNGAGKFGREGNGVQPLSIAHNMADPRYQNCTACHVRIHGSNSDPLFLR